MINHISIYRGSARLQAFTGTAAVIGLLLASTAMAQTVPGSADVTRVQDRVEKNLSKNKAESPLKVEG
jgi:hypothetical protein